MTTQPLGGWESYQGDMILHLFNDWSGPHTPEWWMTNIWNHLRVIDPCVTNNTCDSSAPGQLCRPGAQRCGECLTSYSSIGATGSPAQHGCVYSCSASGSAWQDCGGYYSACASNEAGLAWCVP